MSVLLAVNALLLGAFCIAAWIIMGRRLRGASRAHLARDFEHQLLHDDLTKLPNRTLFRDRLERALARSVRRRASCAVLSVDVDRFKLVNDGLGPDIGDLLLREAATRLDACLRPEDTVARTGGDEFMVLLETLHRIDEATAVAGRITAALAPPFQVADRELFLTASIGIALGRGGRDRPEDVLQNADVAVHRAKDNGRARVEVFRQEMNPHPTQRLGLETELRRAVENLDFTLDYQPNVQLTDGAIVGYEALVRWSHPDRGSVPPLEFIPVAEETGLILPLGRWVLQEACKQAAAWSVLAPQEPEPILCVNLSARQLQQPRMRLVDEVASALANSGLSPASLCLEITEGALMHDVEAAVATMNDLRRLGVGIALDDFGTGYSSLSYLRRFPLDIVKIDRTFVCELCTDPESEAIVQALIDVSHALRVQVLGEGIETREQAKRLRELGCDLGQGHYFAPALPPQRFEPLLVADARLLDLKV